MVYEAVLTNISEMIDLAIGTPEVGVVDFSMLHTVLHCLAQQMRVLGKHVELRGNVAALPVGRPGDNTQTIAISEFVVDTGATRGYELAKIPPTADQDTVLVVERVRKVEATSGQPQGASTVPVAKPGTYGGGGGMGTGGGGGGMGAGGGGMGAGGGGGGMGAGGGGMGPGGGGGGTGQPASKSGGYGGPPTDHSATGAPSGPLATPSTGTQGPRPMTAATGTGPSSEKLSLVTLSKFNILEGTVEDLKHRVYGSMPKNENLLQEVRSQGNLKAITDMWTNLNVSSRLEAAEEGIGKLSSLIQDLIGETVELQKATGGQPSAAASRMTQVAKQVTAAAQSPRGPPSGGGYGPGGAQGAQGQPGAPGQPGMAQQFDPSGAVQGVALGPGGVPMGPGGVQMGLGGVPMSPGGVQIGPGGVQMGSGGVPMGPGAVPMGPGAVQIGQGGVPMGPGGAQMGPGGVPMGPGGVQMGPGGVQMGPGGVMMGPGGVMMGPGGVALGPGGVAVGPGGAPLAPMVYAPGAPGTQGQATMYGMSPADLSSAATKEELLQMLNYLQQLRNDLNILTETFYTAMKEVNNDFVPPAALPPPSVAVVGGGGGGMAYGPGGGAGPGAGPGAGGATMTQYQPMQMGPMAGNVLERLNELEKQLKRCCDTIKKSDGLVNDQLASFQDQLEYLSKQVNSMGPDLGTGKLSPDLVKDLQGLMQLFQTVQEMKTQLQQVHKTALQLAAEKEDRQNHIDALLEQIELLKTIKLDREDMVEALADKADLRMLARKVSHDQFEMACDDLSKGLEHALGKLNVQEALWQQALDDIQREIETKLDKMELSPVKDFFNNKLKQLQENLKQMAALRREAEAAGTKRRLLRDVNCISCDAKAVMAMDAPPPLPSKPLPATLSMKPYLSYELDAIRKSQGSSLPQRNMHDWEHIDKQMQPTKPYKVRSEIDKHLCNRYCGGSHTVTTPAQRVSRLGHFIKQWGPEVLPLSSGFAAGDDGRLYKVSNVEGANVGPGGAVEEGAATCTPKSPVKKSSAEAPKGPKPIIISAECRCLDPAERPSKTND